MKPVICADQAADRCWSTGWEVLIKQLIGADKAAKRVRQEDEAKAVNVYSAMNLPHILEEEKEEEEEDKKREKKGKRGEGM